MDFSFWFKAPKTWFILAILLTISASLTTFGIFKLSSFSNNFNSVTTKPTIKLNRSVLSKTTIIIDVSGAVEKPGVYELEKNSRLLNALKAAGGLSTSADRYLIAKNFNLAKKLSDEEKVYLPFLEERQDNVLGVYESTVTNINTASITQLELLPGIGPVRGQKIIDNRPYQQLEELVSKKVLGEATYLKLSGLISL